MTRPHRRPPAHPRRRARGLMLIECMLAVATLTLAASALLFAMNAAHTATLRAAREIHAARLAEALADEIASRPIADDGTPPAGASRVGFTLLDYDGLHEPPGALLDASGQPCDTLSQTFSREVSVTPATLTLAGLGGAEVAGHTVTVRVSDEGGVECVLDRFVPQP